MEYTPQILAEKRRMLALEYRKKLMELAEIKKVKPRELILLMAEHGSKAKAEVYWSATDKGQEEIVLEFTCRGLLETMRALKTECDLKNNEAFGTY